MRICRISTPRLAAHSLAAACWLALLAGCGGGGSDNTPSGPTGANGGALAASSTLAQRCAAPRPSSTIDPFTGSAYGDMPGAMATEKAFLRSWIDETYFWYADVRALPAATLDPAAYATPVAYFAALKTSQQTASGQPRDKFHFTYNTSAWANLALNDTSFGYGFEIALLASAPPRGAVIAYLNGSAGTPAAVNNVLRGARIVSVDGVDLANGTDVAKLNAGLFPSAAGAHTFVIRDPGASASRTVTLNAQTITGVPVQNVKALNVAGAQVGYLQFNDHTASSEAELLRAITQLKAANVTELVLDMRYNGGGYLDIASELAYMIAGPALTNGKTFERTLYNERNPFNLTAAQTTIAFHSFGQGFSVPKTTALPTLGLARVYILTSANTCSASEAVVNGLRGAGVTVNLIGSQTCGKPYGFHPTDNCGTTYFSVQFQGVNNAGFGDYADGFAPTCQVADDYAHALGDPAEAQLDMALGLRAKGTCSPLAGTAPPVHAARANSPQRMPETGVLVRNPFRENRILRTP
jgi:carboxyl-terminal processing protease